MEYYEVRKKLCCIWEDTNDILVYQRASSLIDLLDDTSSFEEVSKIMPEIEHFIECFYIGG